MRVLAVFALALGFSAACASSADDAGVFDGTAGMSATGGEPSNSDQPTSLVFEMVQDLPARAQVKLKVKARPAKAYRVRFALPTSSGDPLDAVLDQATADTDANGIASVMLTAPSAPAEFQVRASVGGVSGFTIVKVTDTGFASLQVQPLYAGFRMITTWEATAHTGMTCAQLTGIPPEDGPLHGLPASALAAPQLDGVPAGTPLAVTLRSGHFVGGCASLEKIAPGPPDKPQIVQVTVLDRPIDLGASPLAVSLSLPAADTTWSAFLQTAGDAVLSALPGTSTDDVDALLDAMREAAGGSRQAFENARKAESWDDLLRQRWGTTAATKLRDACAGWLLAGRQKFADSEHLLSGTLTPIEQAGSPLDQRSADFALLAVAGLDGATSGFVDRAQVSWSAASDDTLVLGTDLYLIQSRLAQALAESAALESRPDASTGAQLLAETLDCAGASAALAASGANTELGYEACDAGCLAQLCEAGVAAIWQRGSDASALSPARLSITATGTARVGDAAEVAGVGGTWIGALTSADDSMTTGGPLTAVAPAAE